MVHGSRHVDRAQACTPLQFDRISPADINMRIDWTMVTSAKTRVLAEVTVLLVFLMEASISWSLPELLYLRVLKNILKITNSRLI
jgi:hypothetical protein